MPEFPNCINKVGIELEGLWYSGNTPDNFYDDSSIEFSNLDDCENYYIGECSFCANNIDQLFEWIKCNYPNESNHTCSAHIHTSFKSDQLYTLFTKRKFYSYFLNRFADFGVQQNINPKSQFWRRLSGSNHYAQRIWQASEQLKSDCNSNRYTHLNFCFSEHRTIECRLLPLFKNQNILFNAIDCLLSIYSDYLTANLKDFEKLKQKISRRIII